MPRWLEAALDNGITEWDFWQMTIAELNRAIESKQRVRKREAEERASYDYILADLVGQSVSRIYSSSNKMPSIAEAYPTIFDRKELEEQKQRKQVELSALRFRQFAAAYNAKYKDGDSV